MSAKPKPHKFEDTAYGMLLRDYRAKTNGNFADVAAFHEKFGLLRPRSPRKLPLKVYAERFSFMLSEVIEFQEAYFAGDEVKQLDSLLDLVYVAMGTAVMAGYPWEECWAHVHAANMQKELVRGKRDYKNGITKPKGWQSPDMQIAVELGKARRKK